LAIAVSVGAETHLAAVPLGRRDLRLGRGLGHDDGHRDALLAPGVGDRLRGVAGAERDDPRLPRRGIEPTDRVQRAPHLERAGALEVLELEVRVGADALAERMARHERRPVDAVPDRDPGALDLSEPDGHWRSLPRAVSGPARIRTWDQQIMSPPL
jgi:hypothetical protein